MGLVERALIIGNTDLFHAEMDQFTPQDQPKISMSDVRRERACDRPYLQDRHEACARTPEYPPPIAETITRRRKLQSRPCVNKPIMRTSTCLVTLSGGHSDPPFSALACGRFACGICRWHVHMAWAVNVAFH